MVSHNPEPHSDIISFGRNGHKLTDTEKGRSNLFGDETADGHSSHRVLVKAPQSKVDLDVL